MSPSNERSAEWLRGRITGLQDISSYVRPSQHNTIVPLAAMLQITTENLAAAEAREAGKLTKAQWIEQYGGQAVLDREGFDVVPCVDCGDSICHGWRVVRREAAHPTAAEVIAAAEKCLHHERQGLQNLIDFRGFWWGGERRYGALTMDEITDAMTRMEAVSALIARYKEAYHVK